MPCALVAPSVLWSTARRVVLLPFVDSRGFPLAHLPAPSARAFNGFYGFTMGGFLFWDPVVRGPAGKKKGTAFPP